MQHFVKKYVLASTAGQAFLFFLFRRSFIHNKKTDKNPSTQFQVCFISYFLAGRDESETENKRHFAGTMNKRAKKKVSTSFVSLSRMDFLLLMGEWWALSVGMQSDGEDVHFGWIK